MLASILMLALTAGGTVQAQQAANGPGWSGNAAHGGRAGSVSPIPTSGLKVAPFTSREGKKGWKVTIPGGRALATPAVVDGMVFVGGGFGSNEFYAFDAETGKPRWAIRVSDDGPTAAVVAEGKVIFNTESCTLFVVDARTGKQIWSRWLGDPLMSQPAVHAGVVYMAYPGGDGKHRLAAMKLEDGRTLYEREIGGDIVSAPVVEGDSLYLTTTGGTVYRYALSDGRLLFEKDMQATSAPFVAGGEVHVAQRKDLPAGAAPAPGATRNEGFRKLSKAGDFRGDLQAEKSAAYINPSVQDHSAYSTAQAKDDSSVGFGAGAPAGAKTAAAKANLGQGTVRGLWEFQGSRPTVVKEHNYTAQGDVLRAVDTGSGKVLWEKKLPGDAKKIGGHLASPPAYADGKLVVGTATGEVVVHAAQGGQELLRVGVGEEIRFQPALSRGRIYVGTSSGTLVAIESGDPKLDGWTMWGGGPGHNGPEGN